MSFTKLLACGLFLVVAAPATGQVQIEKRRPAPVDGELSVSNAFGSVKIRGWDQPEVLVQGTLAPGAEEIGLHGDEDSVDVDVDVPEAWFYSSDDDTEYQTHLTIFAPAGSSVDVETLNAAIEIEAFFGEIEVETVDGSVVVRGQPSAVEIESMTGTVEVQATGAPMAVETISADVKLRGVTDEVEVETVSGNVEIIGADLESVHVETTSGSVVLQASVCSGQPGEGDVEIATFSGAVGLVFPSDVAARFELRTFSGEIRNDIGPKSSARTRFRPHKNLRFSTGLDDCEVTVDTHSGDISLQTAAGQGGN